ncbi:MAG: hypothetical protein ABL900_11125 [Burkholderiaceae bacterium]
MIPVIQTVAAPKARANRLRWWWQLHMGWAGVAALVIIVAGSALLGTLRPQIEAKRNALVREQVAKLDSLTPQRAKAALGAEQADWRERLHSSIPPLSRRGESVAKLLDLAGASGVTFDRAEYASLDQEPNLSRLKVTLPFGGSYAQTRAVIARLLNGLPNAALDSIDIERPNVELKTLEGTLRLSLYFRKDAP